MPTKGTHNLPTSTETDILYQISSKLAVIKTPNDWLELVSIYARQRGARAGYLFFVVATAENPSTAAEVSASWIEGHKRPLKVETQVNLVDFWTTTSSGPRNLDEPLLIEDIKETNELPDSLRDYYTSQHVQAVAFLPQQVDGQVISGLEFHWHDPVVFDENDYRILKIITQLSGAVIYAMHLIERECKITSRAKQIGAINIALSQTVTEDDILSTITDFAVPFGAKNAELLYLANREEDIDDLITTSLLDHSHWQPFIDNHCLMTSDSARDGANNQSTAPYFIEDVKTDPNLTEANRIALLNEDIHALTLLPLRCGESLRSILIIHWPIQHHFTVDERYIFRAILPTISAVVERQHATLKTRNSEKTSSILFQLAELINAAMTYQQIVDAVARLQPQADGIILNHFENWDYGRATYFEMLAAVQKSTRDHVQVRLPVLPIIGKMLEEKLWVSENTIEDPRFEHTPSDVLEKLPTRAHMIVPLRNGDQNWGLIAFNYNKPRIFTQRERQLALGIGDLVNAAAERIRLQQESMVARKRAETLATLNAAFSKASNETDMLRAFAAYAKTLDVYRVELAYAEHQHRKDDPYAAYLIALWMEGETTDYYRTGNEPRHVKSNEYVLGDYWIPHPDRVLYIEDVNKDPRIEDTKRDLLINTFKTSAAVIMPLIHRGRFQGLISLNWHHPHTFSADERYVLEQLFQTLPAIIASRRVYVAEQEARLRTQTMAAINTALLQASDEAEILAAVAEYAGSQGATGVIINYVTSDDDVSRIDFKPVARWIFKQPFPYRIINDGENFHEAILEIRDLSIQNPDQIIYIENLETDERINANVRANFITQYPMRAEAVLGLRSGGRWQGSLIIMWHQPHIFSEHEHYVYEQIVQSLSRVVATRRAYLAAQEAREETTLLYQVSEAINSAMTFSDVIKAIAPLAREIQRVYLILWENLDYRQASYFEMTAGIDNDGTTPVAVGTRFTEAEFPVAPHVLEHRQLAIENIDVHPLVDPITHAGWTASKVKALLLVALVQDQRWYGTLSFESSTPRRYSERDRRLTLAISDLVLSAILRIHAQHELAKAAHEQRLAYLAEQGSRAENELLYKVSRDINQATTFNDVMQAVARCFPEPLLIAIFALENYDLRGATYTETLISNDPGLPTGTRLPREIFDLMTPDTHAMMVIHDVNSPEVADHAASNSARRFGILSVAFANLTQDQRVVGVFAIGCKFQRNFTDRELRLMSGVTDLTGAALERFRLRDETEQARLRAHELAALEERTRLARELHDSVSQALYGIGLGAQTAYRHLDKDPEMVRESVEYVLTLAEAGLTEMRALIFELRPESLETEGLVVALAKQGASIQARHGIRVHLELSDEPDLSLPSKESLYRVTREALHNVVKHANATQITLRMRANDEGLELDVFDDGIGFNSHQEFPGHLGLHSMRERIVQLGGNISIVSVRGQGTQLSVRLPNRNSSV